MSGIDFVNEITESNTLNILTEIYIYNGWGVGGSDFNNDELADAFLWAASEKLKFMTIPGTQGK